MLAVEIAASAFALAGVDWPDDHARLDGALAVCGWAAADSSPTTPSPRCAPASGQAGCVSSAGTGAVAAGRNAAGETARTMALGFGELGGAGDIVQRAIWACARMREASGPETALAPALCGALGVRDLDDLFESITRRGLVPAPSWRRSCSSVAAGGDEVARALLAEQGRSLADEVLGVARRLRDARRAVRARDRRERASRGVGVARRRVRGAGGRRRAGARIVPLRERAVVGAGRLALDLLEE